MKKPPSRFREPLNWFVPWLFRDEAGKGVLSFSWLFNYFHALRAAGQAIAAERFWPRGPLFPVR